MRVKLLLAVTLVINSASILLGRANGDYDALKTDLSDGSETRQAGALRELESRALSSSDVRWLLECFGWKNNRLAGRGNVNLRRNSAYLLGVAGDSRAVPALTAGLDSRMDYECALALAKIDDGRAAPTLCGYLKDGKGSKVARGAACYALGRLSDPAAMPAMLNVLGESGRVFPQWDLLRFGAAAVDPVIRAVGDKPSPELAFTLGELRDPRAVPCLASLAKQPKTNERLTRAALFALRKIGTEAAMNALESIARDGPDAALSRMAQRLCDDALPADSFSPTSATHSLGTWNSQVSQRPPLSDLDKLIESYDVPWHIKEQARDRAEQLRRTYRFPGRPNTWDSVVFLVRAVQSADGSTHRTTEQELDEVRRGFDGLIDTVDSASQGRLKLRLHFYVLDSVPQLKSDSTGSSALPSDVWRRAKSELNATGADHMFLTWVVPDGVKGPPYSNGGAMSQIPIKRNDGVPQFGALGALHEMVHSMNNCLWGVGYEEGQMPNLHFGVARILYRAKRLDGTSPDRVHDYLRRYFTGGMWAKLSRADPPVGNREWGTFRGDTGVADP